MVTPLMVGVTAQIGTAPAGRGNMLAIKKTIPAHFAHLAAGHAQGAVINWHVTEACNFGCQYCYAKWLPNPKPELIRDGAQVKAMLMELARCFEPGNAPRLNFAGGEPFLYPEKLTEAIRYAVQVGMTTSVITNGSRLTPGLIEELAPNLAILGVSLDSGDETINRAIGRADRKARVLPSRDLADLVALARRVNPNLLLKINTVVNALNWREDMSGLIDNLAPDKWKILQMLPTVTDALVVSTSAFDAFIERHQRFHQVMRVEDNDQMTASYIMIDPYGRFFQNVAGEKNYCYSDPILEVGALRAFSQMDFSSEKFCSRYADGPEAHPS